MFKKQRKLFTCFLLATMVITSAGNASALAAVATPDSSGLISIQSTNTTMANIGINISNSGVASVSAFVMGKIGVSKIQITVTLQKYNSGTKSWNGVKSWDKTYNSTSASFSSTYSLGSKGTYRTKLTANVWKDGKKETVTGTSGSQTY